MLPILKRHFAALVIFCAGLLAVIARWMHKDRKTTAAGILALTAWLASHYNFVVSEEAQEWIVMIGLLVIAKLAKDSGRN